MNSSSMLSRTAPTLLKHTVGGSSISTRIRSSGCDAVIASNLLLRTRERYGRNNLLLLHRGFAGHNKWSKIRHKKGAKDVHRAKIFSKATRAIRAASKACSGDLSNLHLQSAIQSAKAIQVPKDRIEDAINCANKGSNEDLVTMRYDGHLNTPSGKISLILTALTDNKNRTAANVRAKMRKSHGELLSTGAHDWLFDHFGIVLLSKDGSKGMSEEEEETILEHALEAGASDVDFGDISDEHITVKCAPTELHSLVVAMRDSGYDISEFKNGYEATSNIELDEESTEILTTFLEKMDDDEDVNDVFFNASLYEED